MKSISDMVKQYDFTKNAHRSYLLFCKGNKNRRQKEGFDGEKFSTKKAFHGKHPSFPNQELCSGECALGQTFAAEGLVGEGDTVGG